MIPSQPDDAKEVGVADVWARWAVSLRLTAP